MPTHSGSQKKPQPTAIKYVPRQSARPHTVTLSGPPIYGVFYCTLHTLPLSYQIFPAGLWTFLGEAPLGSFKRQRSHTCVCCSRVNTANGNLISTLVDTNRALMLPPTNESFHPQSFAQSRPHPINLLC